MKINKKLVLPLFLLVALVAVSLYRHQNDEAALVPTKDISSIQSIGGTPVSQPDNPSASKTNNSLTGQPEKPPIGRTTPDTAPDPTPQSPDLPVLTEEYQYRALGITPNDTYYSSNWAFQKVGAPTVWDKSTGSAVVVAVIDTGFALQHEDLVDSWYQNPGETGLDGSGNDKSNNGIDDDSNGYIDDWRGWNFYGRYQPTTDPCAPDGLGTYVSNNNPQAGQSGDDIMYAEYTTCYGSDAGNPYEAISHGTTSAGLAGATSNNSRGIATLNWNTKIMPLQALGDDGSGWTSKITAAIRYAVDNGAQVINMSLGGGEVDPSMKAAIQYAYDNNVVVVAAAGNCGTGMEYGCDPSSPGKMLYPALYPHVIAVGATDQNDSRASFSSYGRGLDIVAPGYGSIIAPTINTGGTPFNYTNSYSGGLAGTSFASPIVASAASLIRSARPNSSVDDVVALINASARKPSAMSGKIYTTQYGHGVIDAGTAVTIANSLQSDTSIPTYGQTGGPVSEHSFRNSDGLSSGCTTSPNGYCTIRFTEYGTGFERFLPYKASDAQGQAGWYWSGYTLDYGDWWGNSINGKGLSSNTYQLLNK